MLEYTYQPRRTILPTRKKSKKGWILLTVFLILLIAIVIQRSGISSVPATTPESVQNGTLGMTDSQHSESPKRLISELLSDTRGTYSVYVFDINKNEGIGVNEETVITAASVNKIPILAALYHLAGKNEIDLEKIITPQPDDIQDYGTGSIRYDPPGTAYSIKTLARLMMEKSDNTAAYILGQHVVGNDTIQTLVESWGLTQTNMSENKTSVKDMSILIVQMYQEKITTAPLTRELLNFMDESDFEDRIPALLPTGLTVYHKIGDEVNKIHDVGIIDLPGRPYYIGIMTTDQTDENATKRKIAEISKVVFEFMSK